MCEIFLFLAIKISTQPVGKICIFVSLKSRNIVAIDSKCRLQGCSSYAMNIIRVILHILQKMYF